MHRRDMANPNQPHNQQNRPQQNQQHQNRPQQQNPTKPASNDPSSTSGSVPPEPNNSTDNLRSNQYEQGREERLAEHIAQDDEVQFRSAVDRWTHDVLEGIRQIMNKESSVPEVKMRLLTLFQSFSKTDRELVRVDLATTKIKNIVESLMMDISSITSEKW